MTYLIEYANGHCQNSANSREDLIVWLRLLREEEITDIRKIYKDGTMVSVLGTYEKYIEKTHRGRGKEKQNQA